MDNYDDHGDQEANSEHDDAAYHPKGGPRVDNKVVSGSSEDDTSYKSLWHAEEPSQAGQVAAWTRHFLPYSVNQEDDSGHQGEDDTQDADDAGAADEDNRKDHRGRADHHGTQHGQPAAQVGPVGEEGRQEDVPRLGLHHNQDQGHDDAENPDELAPHAPWTHHPVSEDDHDEGQSAEDYFQEA